MNFAQLVAALKDWYQERYGIRLTNYKLAEQVTQRTNRRAYFRTISAIEAGHIPAWDVGQALRSIHEDWCTSTLVPRETQETSA